MHIASQLITFISIGSSMSFFIPSKNVRFTMKVTARKVLPTRVMHTNKDRFNMYFDDVSRSKYTIPWNEDGEKAWQSYGDYEGFYLSTDVTADINKKYHAEKLDALHKSLYGYDPKSASLLTIEEVENDMRFWYNNAEVGNTFFQIQNFEKNNETIICKETNIIGCLTFMWRQISIYTKNRNNDNNQEKTMMVVFPYCNDLYTFDTIEKLYSSMQNSQDLCSDFGNEYDVSNFHPTYENEPKMLSLVRHSPFPSFGMHYKRSKWQSQRETLWVKEEVGIDHIFGGIIEDDTYGESQDEIVDINSIFNDYFDQSRNDFENLFNSAAATSESSESLFRQRKYSDTTVIAMINDWIKNNQSEGKQNRALRFAGTNNDRWTVTNTTSEEELYHEIWSTIDELYKVCTKDESDSDELKSTMFVTTKYSQFNANQFKRFAVSINGILKHFTNGMMFLELFHPEFVGKTSKQSSLRRSPFPVLQIICQRRNNDNLPFI